ncbi:uncharacterized protein MEPE_01392 [Melanopsichium pennsylvanicum]|uniref:Uncharacterized protein n=2 Tax=Melanopsichium pennsylvanicum TaxID=63383 RepID=A0AAJ4XIN4_9BASI|nr:uncharacterized protein BN887_03981 [Melanopsichium pennsylvanicum 4]SNX82686.1 uncharacterized protein MEPE_01392 [Melanopsichium pennsylvanicum]
MKSFAFVLSALVLAGGTTAATMARFKQEIVKADPSGLKLGTGGYDFFCTVTVEQLSTISRACFKADWGVTKNLPARSSDNKLDGYISKNNTSFVVETNTHAFFQLDRPHYPPINVYVYNHREEGFDDPHALIAVSAYKKSHHGQEPPKGCLAVVVYAVPDAGPPKGFSTFYKIHCPGTDEPIDLKAIQDSVHYSSAPLTTGMGVGVIS